MDSVRVPGESLGGNKSRLRKLIGQFPEPCFHRLEKRKEPAPERSQAAYEKGLLLSPQLLPHGSESDACQILMPSGRLCVPGVLASLVEEDARKL